MHLRKMGFLTFSPFINETYDFIMDNTQRLQAIYNEIRRLNRLPTESFQKLLKKLNKIAAANAQVAHKIPRRIVEKLFSSVFREASLLGYA